MWVHVLDVQFEETPNGVRAFTLLSGGGALKPVPKLAPDLATARRWYEPLVGCRHWLRDES